MAKQENIKNNWKDTILLPKTSFEMRANLKEKENYFFEWWKENNIYRRSLKKNKNNKVFFLHDGPPYANGNLHVGHALNKILKDFIIRYKCIKGFYSPLISGWDTHGLPIENKVIEILGTSKEKVDPALLRRKAYDFALEQVEIQKKQFEKMQLFFDFKDIYLTLDKTFIVNQLNLFKKMALDNLIYKGLKPIYWSPSSQSALAEAEIIYKKISSPSIIVSFKVIKGNKIIDENCEILIMTTTPWTLIANAGVAVNKNIKYVLMEVKKRYFIVAEKLVNDVKEKCSWTSHKILKSFSGKDIEGILYKRPLSSKSGKVVLSNHVNIEAGTGLVHIAPLFGEDDFIVGKREGLDEIMHIDDDGIINKYGNDYQGMFYLDANKKIGQYLDNKNQLHSLKFITHSYPHDWRTEKPVIYRATPQWFIAIKKIKNKILKSLINVTFYPEWGKKRLIKMFKDRDDWTISRQRYWGVPLIIFYDKNKKPIFKEEIFNYVISLIEKHGLNIWWEWEVDKLLPPEFRNLGFKKEKDIIDVWFDSGASHLNFSLLKRQPPFDLYLEGTDQYRGWFNSSLITSVAYWMQAPYKKVISHGFVLDEKMQKMSKSKNNIIDPLNIINKYGAEILRLWVANCEYTSDISISEKIIIQNAEIYRKIRNTIRFMLGNLNNFKFSDRVRLTGFHLVIKEKLENLKKVVTKNYNTFKFQNAIKKINNFLIEISNYYFDFHKDTLYIDDQQSIERKRVQTIIYDILDFILLALSPILPTTTEEAYSHFNKDKKLDSIFLERWNFKGHDKNIHQKKWEPFMELKAQVYKEIENAKSKNLIKKSNEAILFLDPQKYDQFKNVNLKKMLMVADVKKGKKLEIKFAENYSKCNRCWNYFNALDDNLKICSRCKLVTQNKNNNN